MDKILIADDEELIRKTIRAELQGGGYDITLARDGMEAAEFLRSAVFDIAVLDIRMPYKDGLSLLKEIKAASKDTTVIIITAHGSIDNAVQAMKMGADDYIAKPFDHAELHRKIDQHLQIKRRMRELPIHSGTEKPVFWGKHPTMVMLERTIQKIKDLNTTVLITGESGTGKGVIARELHYQSCRAAFPFVHVDCAALPHNLMESELFGHEKGAFTSANAAKKGKFELAGKGTIFLDEIGTLPLELQSKLLNVLQERRIDKVGGVKKLPMEARVIAATNEDLEARVASGAFREDLFYRLNVIRLEAPPLRYRKSDIPDLARFFVDLHTSNMGKAVQTVEPAFWDALRAYDWPGNIRELENALESAIALCEDQTLRLTDLPVRIGQDAANRSDDPDPMSALSGGDSPLSLEQQEILTIAAALERNGGHREKTAQDLGISRRTLQYKLKRYHMI